MQKCSCMASDYSSESCWTGITFSCPIEIELERVERWWGPGGRGGGAAWGTGNDLCKGGKVKIPFLKNIPLLLRFWHVCIIPGSYG